MQIPDFDVFISYNFKDEDAVRNLAARIRHAGLVPWIAPDGIDAGVSWGPVLDEALARGIGCAIFIGPHGLGQWQELEYHSAVDRYQHDRTYHVVPVLLPGSDDQAARLPQLMRRFQRVDFRGGLEDEAAFRALVDTFRRPQFPAATSTNAGTGSIATPFHKVRREHMTASTADAIDTPPPVSRFSDNTNILQRHIKAMTFTPVIGYGCSLIGRSRGAAWRRIADEMRDLLAYIPSEDPAAAYVRKLAATPVYEVPLNPVSPEPAGREPEQPLLRLQLMLARLGAKLGSVFATEMLESATPVWDSPTYRLPISAGNPNMQGVAELLFKSCVAAYELKKGPEGKDHAVGLEPTGLYDRLIDLAADLMPSQPRADQLEDEAGLDERAMDALIWGDLRNSQRRHATREDAPAEGIELALYHLEWIADALWHTFRYDKPAYPRADELAFQISLLANGARGRRPELAAAAQVGRIQLNPDTVATWFKRYSESPPGSMRRFYDTLARILIAQHEGLTSDRPVLKPTPAVAFTANYDLELEAAFERLDGFTPYHVAIPVNAYREDSTTPELIWLLGTHYAGPIAKTEWNWFPPNQHFEPDDLKGPMLIKLHGSPLHTLPSPGKLPKDHTGAIPTFESFEHALILSEREYMDNIVWKDQWPKYFTTVLLQSNRALYFLGQSLNQWGTRLRIYSQIYRPNNHPATSSRYAIGRSTNPYRSAVLGAIGIHWWIGDLEELSDAVESVLA